MEGRLLAGRAGLGRERWLIVPGCARDLMCMCVRVCARAGEWCVYAFVFVRVCMCMHMCASGRVLRRNGKDSPLLSLPLMRVHPPPISHAHAHGTHAHAKTMYGHSTQVESIFRRANMTLREIGLFQRIVSTFLGGDEIAGSEGGRQARESPGQRPSTHGHDEDFFKS